MSIFNIFKRNKIDPDTKGRKISTIEQELLDRCKNGRRINPIRDYSHVERNESIAFGVNNHATGRNYPATGVNNHATGRNYPATGVNYPATGRNYPATGVNYPATGINTEQSHTGCILNDFGEILNNEND